MSSVDGSRPEEVDRPLNRVDRLTVSLSVRQNAGQPSTMPGASGWSSTQRLAERSASGHFLLCLEYGRGFRIQHTERRVRTRPPSRANRARARPRPWTLPPRTIPVLLSTPFNAPWRAGRVETTHQLARHGFAAFGFSPIERIEHFGLQLIEFACTVAMAGQHTPRSWSATSTRRWRVPVHPSVRRGHR